MAGGVLVGEGNLTRWGPNCLDPSNSLLPQAEAGEGGRVSEQKGVGINKSQGQSDWKKKPKEVWGPPPKKNARKVTPVPVLTLSCFKTKS